MHCFQYLSLCFQYPKYVSNIQIMFPNAFLCFQYPICVSNIRCMFPNENDVSKLQCFQSMFPIYIEPFGAVGAVYLMMKYVRRLVKNFKSFKIFEALTLVEWSNSWPYLSRQRQTPRTLATNGDPNMTVSLPLIKITKISHDTKIFR